MEDAFPYHETPDQLQGHRRREGRHGGGRARWTGWSCGDVGFGKTEVAIRAAFKAVQDGKQVAVLVPTTLARAAALPDLQRPLRRLPGPGRGAVAASSRPRRPQGGRGLADGEVDVVIGTHRLLSGDIKFKDLGLLVVDEEQRFGVSHKEAIKQLKTDVDVLTLTATPIPRTLEMSLTGIRDLIAAATRRRPSGSRSSPTSASTTSEPSAKSIRRELLREGQVFFVHNRVQDIERVGRGSRELVPEARIAVAHGQMDEGTPREGRRSTSGKASTTCWSARPSSSPASTCRR